MRSTRSVPISFSLPRTSAFVVRLGLSDEPSRRWRASREKTVSVAIPASVFTKFTKASNVGIVPLASLLLLASCHHQSWSGQGSFDTILCKLCGWLRMDRKIRVNIALRH